MGQSFSSKEVREVQHRETKAQLSFWGLQAKFNPNLHQHPFSQEGDKARHFPLLLAANLMVKLGILGGEKKRNR